MPKVGIESVESQGCLHSRLHLESYDDSIEQEMCLCAQKTGLWTPRVAE